MKRILLIALLLFPALFFAQVKKKKKKVYRMPKVEAVDDMPPPLVEDENQNNSKVVADIYYPDYNKKVTPEDEARCLDAFYEKDSLKRETMLKEIGLYRLAETALENYISGCKRTCEEHSQPLFRLDHFKHNCRILTRHPRSGMSTLFAVDFIFDREKYLKECAEKGKNSGIAIPCNFTAYADVIYSSIEDRSPFFSNCFQNE